MEKEIQQLIEMGASAAQARAALKRHKDVMEAAERIFEGFFDDVCDEDGDMHGALDATAHEQQTVRMVTPEADGDDDEAAALDEEDEDEDYMDYESDYESKADVNRTVQGVDPYAGIFFSKERREEVVEVEEEPETATISGVNVPLMTQGQWMKGCPEGGEQAFLFGLYSELSEGECQCPNKCPNGIPRSKSDFFAIFPEFSTYIEHVQSIVRRKCPACVVMFCFACGESIPAEKARQTSEAADDDALFHCPNLQGVILGVGLSMLEQVYADQSQDATPEHVHKSRQSKKRKVEGSSKSSSIVSGGDEVDDVYYASVGKKTKGGVGYAGEQREDNSGQLEAQAVQLAKDEKIGGLLTSLRVYLPSLHRPGGSRTSDYLVHPTALAHLRRRFNTVCSSLLRNDSLADMSDRAVLYFELLEWLETISNHEALASMMAMPCMVAVSVKAVTTKKSWKGGSMIRERTIVYEGSAGPRELLEAIVIQAQAALKGLEGVKQPDSEPEEMTEEQKRMTRDTKGKAKEQSPPPSEEHVKLLSFCQRIVATAHAIDRSLRETKGDAFVERLHKSLPKIYTSSSTVHIDVTGTEESVRKTYVEWATRARFEYCDLSIPTPGSDTPSYKFYYNPDARMLANSDIPKRSLAIAKELAILTTNLPVAWDSSIFLRVDETRVDIIKALITGPEGTPYHNGCYLFDIFLGPNYNQSPPSVKYMTTNGGKFRFNPNLYADGKVCLSLLGTWPGPGWVAGKSTLLQVLISIQSMILCEEPYLNEPGWASSSGTSQSHTYSANVRRMAVKTAMLGNLRNPPEPFQDVIRTHFRLKAKSIIEQLDQWLTQDDGKSTVGDGGFVGPGNNNKQEAGGSSKAFKVDVNELKALLLQLEEDPGHDGGNGTDM